MKIALIVDSIVPALRYGGTERVVCSLGKELVCMGHTVTVIARAGSSLPWAHRMIAIDPSRPLWQQVPRDVDIVHSPGFGPPDTFDLPYIITCHGNSPVLTPNQLANTVFVSADHARRHGCTAFIYNGLDWDSYPRPDLTQHRRGFHFLANGAWRVKNLAGAIETVLKAPGKNRLEVMGASRLNFRMGFRFTLSPRIHFHGMVDDTDKADIISRSQGLIFPVRWHEPFGLAVIESLFFGAPVFASHYGSLPELVTPEVGVLTFSQSEMIQALSRAGTFSPHKCNEYAREYFNSRWMAERYVAAYERILNNEALNTPANAPFIDPRELPW